MGFALAAITRTCSALGLDRSHPLIEALMRLDGAGGGGAPVAPAWIDVADTAALSALPTAGVAWGQIVHVETLDAHYYYIDVAASVIPTAVGLSVLLDSGAGGVWVRIPNAAPTWTQQPAWFIDAAMGNDENNGLAPGVGQALATIEELVARVAPYGIWSPTREVVVTIDYAGGLPYTMPNLIIDARSTPTIGGVQWVGTPSVVSSNTFATVTQHNLATNTLMSATSTNVGEMFLLGEILRLDPASYGTDTYAVAAVAPGGATARFTEPWDIGTQSGFFWAASPPPQTYQRLALPTIQMNLGSITVRGSIGGFGLSSMRLLVVLGGGNAVLDGLVLNACFLQDVTLAETSTFASYVYEARSSTPSGKTTRFQNTAIRRLDVGGETSVQMGFVADPAVIDAIIVHGAGRLTMLTTTAVELPVGRPIQMLEPGAYADISASFCLYGTSKWIIEIDAYSNIKIVTNGSTSTAPLYAGTSGVDLFYAFTDAWFPPLTPGAPVPLSAAVSLFHGGTGLNAAPFSGIANHVNNGCAFLPG